MFTTRTVVGVVAFCTLVAGAGIAARASTPLSFPASTKIFDRNGQLLYELYGEVKRTPVSLSEIPASVQNAAIATEDRNFYSHGAISVRGIVRAAVVNANAGSVQQGGSTITQQLVRTVSLSREKSIRRKLHEVALSILLEARYSKQQILEMYLNDIPYGSNAYGVEAASRTFFGKDVHEVTLAEAAYLAALPKAPSYYSPYGNHRDALSARSHMILRLMKEQGYITEQEMNDAIAENVSFKSPGTPIIAPHFVMYVIDQLRAKYGDTVLLQKGLIVHTTLSADLQKNAEQIISEKVVTNEKRYRAGNAALVSLDPATGEILAMVGSRNFFDVAHNGAVNVALRPRQPGSSFKPYVYATAFEHGMNAATVLMDVQTDFGTYGNRDYVPKDYDGKERGPVSVRQALQGSLNIPAVKTLMLYGIPASVATATNMGISTLSDHTRLGPSLVLGGAEVTLLDHTSAYGVFAEGGIRHAPYAITEIDDANGTVLQKNSPSEGTRVIPADVAYQITNILSDNASRQYIFHSLSKNLVLPDRPVAAKTGTTQKNRDAWTLGYTTDLVTGVWVGNNDNSAMKKGADGSVVAAPIWHDFMVTATAQQPAREFTRPPGIIELTVDADSGQLPGPLTRVKKTEVFSRANAPTAVDALHRVVTVNDEPKVVALYHSEKPDDPHWEGAVQRWLASRGYYPYIPAPPPPPEIDPSSPPEITTLATALAPTY